MKQASEFMGETMTVKELIDKLSALNDLDLPVYTEGCDCVGNAVKIEHVRYADVEYYLINRNN